MFRTLVNAFKNKEVRIKIFITLALLFVYRLGCWLPIPGINPTTYTDGVSDANSIFGLLSAISGGALRNGAVLAIGISPYINASIIIQLLTFAIKPLEEWSKQGDEGKKKITQLTRFVTLALALAQAIGVTISYGNGGLATNIFGASFPIWVVGMFVVLIMVAGTSFTMWLGERITELGVGNGISLLIFVGIVASAGQAISASIWFSIQNAGTNDANMKLIELLGFMLLVVVIFVLIVFIDLGERRIPIQYAKQIKGRKQYGGQSTHIPIKVNASGVLPIIFASALITFPSLLMSIINPTSNWGFTQFLNDHMAPGKWLNIILTGLFILFFSYFYAKMQFNPDDISRNIQQYGGFIPGIRPGKPTAEYLGKISNRLTLFGAIFLAFIAIVPSFIFGLVIKDSSLVNAFSATGLLIVVSVALEFDKQLEGLMLSKQARGFLK